MIRLHIVHQEDSKKKGRSFQATLASYVCADSLWTGGDTTTENIRPVFSVVVSSPAEIGPFMANVRMGTKASLVSDTKSYSRRKTDQYEWLKSAGYQHFQQKHTGAVSVTSYLPDLFTIDPGMVDPDGIKFIALPSKKWSMEQNVDVSALRRHLRKLGTIPDDFDLKSLGPTLVLFGAYLDRRTRCPLVSDPRFYVQLSIELLRKEHASFLLTQDEMRGRYHDLPFGKSQKLGFSGEGIDQVGIASGIACKIGHSEFEAVLAEQAKRYYEVV